MAERVVRGAIVGASTLLGKELADELNSASAPVWDLTLLDADEAGRMTSAGDEAIVIQAITHGAFDGIDIVFFAGDAATTRKHWKEAHAAGASVVDCCAVLEGEAGVLVRAPWVETSSAKIPDLTTKAVVPAHPAAVMLALVVTRLRTRWGTARVIATVMEPASQQGQAGLAEIHQQTVALLSFQPLQQDVYDAQVAFNLSAESGEAAKADMSSIAAQLRKDFASIAGEAAANALALQLLQAPVFHGYTASVFVEIDAAAEVAEIEQELHGGILSVTAADASGPSNLSATEQGQILLSVRAETGSRGFWIWMAADNLRLTAQNAAACAAELVALRPVGRVQ